MGLIRQIALGIFYLHQCKLPVLHLDLKSANVLLDEHGIAKVCDFGLSHIKKETAVITARMGSPQWSAPEILRGQPHDESADSYSFGVRYEVYKRFHDTPRVQLRATDLIPGPPGADLDELTLRSVFCLCPLVLPSRAASSYGLPAADEISVRFF